MSAHSRDSETVAYWTNACAVEVVGDSPPGKPIKGVIIATNERLVFFSKSFIGEFFKEIRLGHVSSVEVQLVKSNHIFKILQKDQRLIVIPTINKSAEKLASVIDEYSEFELIELPPDKKIAETVIGTCMALAIPLWFMWPSEEPTTNHKPSYASAYTKQATTKTLPDVVCTHFDVTATMSGNDAIISVNTDLPDETKVSISVYRGYTKEDLPETFVNRHFYKSVLVGDTDQPIIAGLDADKWNASLNERLVNHAKLGISTASVKSISDNINVSATIAINQPNSIYMAKNKNLKGCGVKTGYNRTISRDIVLKAPLGKEFKEADIPNFVTYNTLSPGVIYKVSRRTPMMPTGPEDFLSGASANIKYIASGGGFKVISVDSRDGYKLYEASIYDGTRFHTGWINSSALVGQEIAEYEP